jgi:uncharacterized protein YjbI with pentapeptide repeats
VGDEFCYGCGQHVGYCQCGGGRDQINTHHLICEICDDPKCRAKETGIDCEYWGRGKGLTFVKYENLDLANLAGAILKRAALAGANLKDTDLTSADLRGADLTWANLEGANLAGANLEGAILKRADLSHSNLSCATIRSANLRSANLRSASLAGANLEGALMHEANLSFANLIGARLWDWSRQIALNLEGATMPDGTTYREWLRR